MLTYITTNLPRTYEARVTCMTKKRATVSKFVYMEVYFLRRLVK